MRQPLKLYAGVSDLLDGIDAHVEAILQPPDLCQGMRSPGYDPTGEHLIECRQPTDLFCVECEIYICAICAVEGECVDAKHRIVEVRGHA